MDSSIELFHDDDRMVGITCFIIPIFRSYMLEGEHEDACYHSLCGKPVAVSAVTSDMYDYLR